MLRLALPNSIGWHLGSIIGLSQLPPGRAVILAFTMQWPRGPSRGRPGVRAAGGQRQFRAMTTPRPTLALIAALDRQRAIGRGGALLWHERADQQHFRALTMGCPVVMGRKTWDSLPPRFRPLPGRLNVVVSRNAGFVAEGAQTASSLDAALALLAGEARVFVIGGAALYAMALPQADTLMLTEVHADLAGDTFFPTWRHGDFDEVSRQAAVSAAGVGFDFVTYRRR